MIKIENIDTWGFENAVRMIENQMSRWYKSDSRKCKQDGSFCLHCTHKGKYCIGINDMTIIKQLYCNRISHENFVNHMFVSMDIIAPLYWWEEFDKCYRNVETNSSELISRICEKKITRNDFSVERLKSSAIFKIEEVIDELNMYRNAYICIDNCSIIEDDVYDKSELKWKIIQLLPYSYNHKRTVTMSYDVVLSIIKQIHRVRLDEWKKFADELKKLPYVKEIIE